MSTLTPGRIVTEARPVPEKRRRREKAAPAAPDRDAQARSFVMRRRMQTIRRMSLLLGIAAIVGGGMWAWKQGHLDTVVADAQSLLPRVSNMPGLQVGTVDVSGTGYLDPQAVVDAAALRPGQKIAELDLSLVRERVEALGWVKTAQVSRLLPDTVRIKVIERVPFGLWQFENKIRVIDGEGVQITDRADGFEHLPMVVDLGAPRHAAGLFAMLEAEPALMHRVEAAVWVGDRRWNIRIHGGVDVLLPESDPEAAWHRLAALQRHQGILDRDIVAIDLRLPDRLTVRQSPEAAEARRSAENAS